MAIDHVATLGLLNGPRQRDTMVRDRNARMTTTPPNSQAGAPLSGAAQMPALLDRDHSILAFNERVLNWAEREDVPLLERLRYLCIVSSNLDEFFEVRAEPHLTASRSDDRKGTFSVQSFEKLSATLQTLVARQYALYNE